MLRHAQRIRSSAALPLAVSRWRAHLDADLDMCTAAEAADATARRTALTTASNKALLAAFPAVAALGLFVFRGSVGGDTYGSARGA
jgi:hypothetical protein